MKKLALPLALVFAAALSAQPALAQKGHGRGHDDDRRGSSVRHDRDDDRWDDRRDRDRRYGNNVSWRNDRRLQRRVPPGWCTGRGNPHNTVANCGPGRDRYDRRYDPRYNRTSDRYSRSTSGRYNTGRYNTSSGRAGYDAWKRSHDLQCRERSRQRPLDLRYQLQVRNQCAAETQDARRRYGV